MLDLTRLPESELSAFVARQPWFRAHGREDAAARVLEATFVHTVAPLLAIALVEVATERGLNEIYQLPSACGRTPIADLPAAIASLDGWTAYDALADPDLAYELVDLVRTAAGAHTDVSAVDFHPLAGPDALRARLRRAARDRRRAFEHLGRRRRGARAQGLPAARAPASTRSSSCCASSRSTVRELPAAARLLRAFRPPDRRDARHRHALRARRVRRLDVRARRRWPVIRRASSSGSSASAR